ncbi:MAG: XRE family transcriptional regulator [Vicinamibacterales bacterium]
MAKRNSLPAVAITAATVQALAATVREARGGKHWTLAELAERSGLSKGMLLQIERARTNPSIGTLIRIANAFGVSVWQLFAAPEDRVRTAAAADALTLWRSPRGGTAMLLIGAASPQPVELWEWRLAPGDVYSADAHFDTTVEVIEVRQGTLTLVVGKRRVTIAAGGSTIARMNARHQYRNEGRVWVRLTMVVVDPRA